MAIERAVPWLTLPKFNMNPKKMVSKRNLLFKGAISRFHVKCWECTFIEGGDGVECVCFVS